MKLIKESLDAGGSIGSIKGNFYEKHFANVLVKLGYESYHLRTTALIKINLMLSFTNIGQLLTNLPR